jgi:hypothetical protein
MQEAERLYARFIWRLIREKERRNLTGGVEPWKQEDAMSVNYPVTPRSGVRLRPGERRKHRVVTRLYPFVTTVPSPEEIEYYRSLGDYALVADRQSDGKETRRQDATGQWGRFQAVQRMAAMYGYYLPDPVENKGRKEGEPMFTCDPRHFFNDGDNGKDASGLVGHPSVRPELWRMGKTIEIVGHLGCAPKAVLVGSEERLFRDTGQFRMWFQALKLFGVKLFVSGMGEVTDQNCSIICMRVEALSSWLGPRSKRAREAKRSRGEAYHTVLIFGIDYPDDPVNPKRKDKSRCIPITDQWQTMRDLALRVPEGKVRTATEASAWLYAEHRRLGRPAAESPCSVTFIRKWFNSTVPEGLYACHTCETSACQVQLHGTMIFDLDVTDNGVIRRFVEPRDPTYLPIDIPAELAIPPDLLAAVRRRLIGRKPRTQKEPTGPVSLFPSYLVRCAHCKTYIVERPPRQGKERPYVENRQEHDEMLVRLRAEGKSYKQIAQALRARLRQETGRDTPVTASRAHKRLQLLGVNGDTLEANLQQVAAFWSDPFRRRNGVWHLYCHCGSVLKLKPNPTDEERALLDPEGHVIKRHGSLTLSAWPALWRACMGHPPTEEEGDPSLDEAGVALEREDLRRQVERLQQEIDAVNQAWWQGEFGDRGGEEAKRQRDSLKTPLESAKAAKTARRDCLSAEIVRQQDERITAEQFERIREIMQRLDAEDPSPVWRQEFVRTFVKRVEVDLATGEWVIETEFEWEDLRRLVGKLGVPTEHLVPPRLSQAREGAVSGRSAEVPGETTTRCRSPWYFRVMARGRLLLTPLP